jgi:hypothetical protein
MAPKLFSSSLVLDEAPHTLGEFIILFEEFYWNQTFLSFCTEGWEFLIFSSLFSYL